MPCRAFTQHPPPREGAPDCFHRHAGHSVSQPDLCMAAFQFQPQHIIANPYTLFFKADTLEHREKLIRSVLPYVLGTVDAKTLEAQARLRKLEGELRLKREQLEQARRAATMWLGRLQAFYTTARDNNLIPDAPEPDTSWTGEIYASHLGRVAARLREQPLPEMPAGATRRAVREFQSGHGIQQLRGKIPSIPSKRPGRVGGVGRLPIPHSGGIHGRPARFWSNSSAGFAPNDSIIIGLMASIVAVSSSSVRFFR